MRAVVMIATVLSIVTGSTAARAWQLPTPAIPPVLTRIPPSTAGIVNGLDARSKNAVQVQLDQLYQVQKNTADALEQSLNKTTDKTQRGNIGGQLANTIDAIQATQEAEKVVAGASDTISVPRAKHVQELIMSLTRPVWLLCDGKAWVKDDRESWNSYVQPFTNKFASSIANVGRLQFQSGDDYSVLGTAFEIAEDLIITNRHVLDEILRGTLPPAPPFSFPEDERITYDVSDEYQGCNPRLNDIEVSVKSVVAFGSEKDNDDYALFTIEHNDRLKPIPLASTTVTGFQRIAVIGYPAEPRWQDNHLTQPQIDQLFAPPGIPDAPFLVKRISPGKIQDIGGLTDLIAYDANTFGGNSGSAIFRLSDGALVGLHVGGIEKPSGDPEYNFGLSAPRLMQILQKAKIAISTRNLQKAAENQ